MRKTYTFLTWGLLLIVAVLAFPAGQAIAADPGAGFGCLPLLGFAGLIDIFDTRTMLEAVEQMTRPGRCATPFSPPTRRPTPTPSTSIS